MIPIMSNHEEFTSKPNILMFCIYFWDYEKRISHALEDAGYHVDLYNERPGDSFIDKVCVHRNIPLYRGRIQKHLKSIIAKHKGTKYDYILVINGETISEKMMSLLRQAFPEAKPVLYLWDSVANLPNCENRLKLYDRVMTFDPDDAARYGIPFLPVPYGKEQLSYAGKASDSEEEYTYDAVFIGTAHSVRPRIVQQVAEICRRSGRSCFTYFYSPHILVYWLNRLTNPDYKWIKKKEIHFKGLSSEEAYRIISKSRCVLDIEHPKQHGTTTRTIEALPMRKKIITTNPHVKDFTFYHENNFCIIDKNHPVIEDSFWDTPYEDVPREIIRQYSPEKFVETLLDTHSHTSSARNKNTV